MPLSDKDFRVKAKALAREVLDAGAEQIGDSGMGGRCPYCYTGCRWDVTLSCFEHKPDCIVNVAAEIVADE